MFTRTGTLTLNAAFLQEIKEDNQYLRALLDRTAAMLSPQVVRVRPRTLAETLGELRDQLATHFSLEEFFGYFDDAMDAAPWLSSQADILRAQHESLFMEICYIVDDAEKLLYGESFPGLRGIKVSFGDFYKKLQDHEESENELIMQALCQDIGVGD